MKRGRTDSKLGALQSLRIATEAIAISVICASDGVMGTLVCAETHIRQVPLAKSSCGCIR